MKAVVSGIYSLLLPYSFRAALSEVRVPRSPYFLRNTVKVGHDFFRVNWSFFAFGRVWQARHVPKQNRRQSSAVRHEGQKASDEISDHVGCPVSKENIPEPRFEQGPMHKLSLISDIPPVSVNMRFALARVYVRDRNSSVTLGTCTRNHFRFLLRLLHCILWRYF